MERSVPLIRRASDGDMEAVTAIYRHYVLTSTATFELEPPNCDEIAQRRASVLALDLPYLVAVVGAEVVGYAYASSYRPRPAYRFTVEDSVYVHPDFIRLRIGNDLLQGLIKECEKGRARQMIAVIGDSANGASIALHEKFEFRRVGTLEKVGCKFDRWVDTVLMQKDLTKKGVDE